MGLIYQQPWTRQPPAGKRVNRASRLSCGLIYLDTGLSPQNCAESSVPAASLVSVTSEQRGGVFGPLIGVGSAISQTTGYTLDGDALAASFAVSGAASVFLVVRSTGPDSAGNFGPIRLRGVNGGDNEHHPFTDGNIYHSTFAQGRWVNGVTPSFALTAPHSYCATHKSGEQIAYLNGAQVATATRVETPNLAPTLSNELRLGANGAVYFVAFWDRILNAAEVARLHSNPWQLFVPLPRRIWAPSAAAGGPPTLSAPGMYGITSTGGYPRVTRA